MVEIIKQHINNCHILPNSNCDEYGKYHDSIIIYPEYALCEISCNGYNSCDNTIISI